MDWIAKPSLRPFVTLRAGGRAEWLVRARSLDELSEVGDASVRRELALTILGWGSNVLPSDAGVPGVVLQNLARRIEIQADGLIRAESGCGFQELFLKSAQAGLAGLSFAVGIPGTLGGALVSNAGAYRSQVSALLERLEVWTPEGRGWVEPTFMEFSYRDSVLRRLSPPRCIVLQVEMRLTPGDPKSIYDEARDYQRQRISKQPPPASAGSFFKNVNDLAFAQSLPNLREDLKKAGVVPAGHLIEEVGLKGRRHGGAMLGQRHANFMLNVGGASAAEIYELAQLAKERVYDRFGVVLEEEVLYLGDWSRWRN